MGSVHDKVKRGRETFLRGDDVRRRESAGVSCKCRAAKGRGCLGGMFQGGKTRRKKKIWTNHPSPETPSLPQGCGWMCSPLCEGHTNLCHRWWLNTGGFQILFIIIIIIILFCSEFSHWRAAAFLLPSCFAPLITKLPLSREPVLLAC